MTLAYALLLALAQAPLDGAADAGTPAQVAVAEPAPLVDEFSWRAIDPKTRWQPDKPWYQRVELSGFARIGAFFTFPVRGEEELVGGRNGFRMLDARINAAFRPVEKLEIVTTVEFAAPRLSAADPLSGYRAVELRDAYAEYTVCKGFIVRAGQYRPPYYAEMLIADDFIPFVTRSLLANGAPPPDAYGPATGLAPDRQLGLMIHSKRLGGDTIGLRYMLGLFNGNGLNQLFNDNNHLEPVGRLEVDLFKRVTLGINASYQVQATGERPNRLYVNRLDYGADLEAHAYGFFLLGGFLGRSSSYQYAALPSESAFGFMGQLRYIHAPTGLEAAVRFAWYEPSSAQSDDKTSELTALLGWRIKHGPVRLVLQYVHREEEQAVSLANDSLDAMVHVVW